MKLMIKLIITRCTLFISSTMHSNTFLCLHMKLLYADDLVLLADCQDLWAEKIKKWKEVRRRKDWG